jgi:hypothetical protein
MKSIKPGRGPSAMGAIRSVAVGVFGIFWTIGAASMGAPTFFVFFGIVFVGIAIIQGIFHFKNATGTNRMSLLDITDNNEEPDPLDDYFTKSKRFDNQLHDEKYNNEDVVNYCPFCGYKVIDDSHKYCSKCGKEIRLMCFKNKERRKQNDFFMVSSNCSSRGTSAYNSFLC